MMPDKRKLQRTMYRWRNAVYPRNPKFQHEIELDTTFFKLRGTPILIQDSISADNENGIMLYSHPDLMIHLKTVTRLACDATYSVTPPFFKQTWILFALGMNV